jgi:hypothetical protein
VNEISDMPFTSTIRTALSRWLQRTRRGRRIAKEREVGEVFTRSKEPHFTNLPADLKSRIVDYLSSGGAVHLSSTSKAVGSDLALLVRPPFRILAGTHWVGDHDTGGIPRIATSIPVFDRKTHSITLKCKWWDQGFGDRKGMMYIVGHELDDDDFNIFSGRLVAESPVAKHFSSTLSLSFHPRAGEMYYLWYKVGGGGRHTLNVLDITIYALVHENATI